MPYFVVDNRKLFYREEGSGPLLLILAGNTASSACFKGELSWFGRCYRTVALDFLGTGQSERQAAWPEDWWRQGGIAAARLLEHLGAPRALVLGCGGGGVAALKMAIDFPERVKAVVADSCVERVHPQRLRREVEMRADPSAEQAAFWELAHGDDWQEVVRADSDLLLAFAERGGDWFEGRLKEIACPVLLTASLRDRALPEIERQLVAMVRQIEGSQLFLVNEGGNPLMWTRRETFRRVASAFLASQANGGGQAGS